VPELTLRSQLGLGLVGCGRFGEFCLTAFATIPNLKLIGVADRDQRRAEVTASAFGVTAYADGERVATLPVTCESVPKALRVLAPALS